MRPKKAIVFFCKSDFMTMDEYIEYMRRPPISDEEVAMIDWDMFLRRLTLWADEWGMWNG